MPGEGFGTYLRQLRESKGLSLRHAAEEAQVSSGYLSQIEGGKRGRRKRGEHFAPHPQILRRLASTYHVPAQELFERAGFFEEQEDYAGFSEAREVDRCFEFVVHDPVLKRVLTTADKRAVVDRYEALTGRRLITWAGDYSTVAKKPDFRGLALVDGVLRAKTVQQTVSLDEVGKELGISPEEVRRLVSDGHLRPSRDKDDLIEKAEVRQLKSFLFMAGLRLMQVRDRRHWPKTDEDYTDASQEASAHELENLKAKARARRRPAALKNHTPEGRPKTSAPSAQGRPRNL